VTVERRLALLVVVVVCVVVRAVHLLAVHDTAMFFAHRIWPQSDMYIFDQWAQRIVGGDPLGRTTYHPILDWMSRTVPPETWTRWFGEAPVYFKAPLYAYLVALLRALFGDPALPMAILQIGASAASTVVLFFLTERLFGAAAAFVAALAFAVYGPAVHYDAVLLRGPWIVLAALLVTWRLVELRERLTARGAGLLGVIVGVALLLNEGFSTLPLLVVVAFAFWATSTSAWAVASVAFAAGLGLTLAPLVVRNVAVGAPPFAVAVTGAWVLALFNASDSDPSTFGYPQRSFVPLMEAADGRVGRVLWLCLRSFDGPGAVLGFYLHRFVGLLTPFEAADNASFYYAAIASPSLGWLPDWAWLLPLAAVGGVLAVAGTPLRSLGPLLPVALALLATNLLAPPLSRYRLPLIVLAFPFAGLAAARAWSWVVSRRFAPLLATLVAMAGVWMGARLLERRFVLTGDTPWARVYRLADFYVSAREYGRQARYRDASGEYLALAAHVPRGSRMWAQALLFAAEWQTQAGERGAARASVDAVTAHASDDPAILVAAGDIYWRVLGDPAAAAGVYGRAAELHPDAAVLAMLQARQRQLDALRPPVTSPGLVR
jgi:hypothetical protein